MTTRVVLIIKYYVNKYVFNYVVSLNNKYEIIKNGLTLDCSSYSNWYSHQVEKSRHLPIAIT